MMRMAKFGPMLLAMGLFLIVICVVEFKVNAIFSDSVVEETATSLEATVFKGTYIQKKMLDDDKYLPMYGSSELWKFDVFHPSNYFKANIPDKVPYLIGRGGMQSLVQFLNFNSVKGSLKGQQMIYVLSPQWFTKTGIDEEKFNPNYSELNAYQFALDPPKDAATRKKAAERLLEFEAVKSDMVLEKVLQGFVKSDVVTQAKAMAILPVVYMHSIFLGYQDRYLSATTPLPSKNKVTDVLQSGISDKELIEKAESTGNRISSRNPFGMKDSLYIKNYKSRLEELRGKDKKESYAESPEYADFQLVLDILKEAGAEPLFISVPVNGSFYDYTEFPKKGRAAYYQQVKEQVKKAGFTFVDFSDREYEKYMLEDGTHISLKGWAYVDIALKEFLSKKEVGTESH